MATRSIHFAKTEAGLDEVWVVYPGTRSYALADGITARLLEESAGVVPVAGNAVTEFPVITPLASDAGACSPRVIPR